MNKTATYEGLKFNVIEEDERYMTLEGHGLSLRVVREDVILEEPEDVLSAEAPTSTEVLTKPEDILTNEKPVGNDIVATEETTENPDMVKVGVDVSTETPEQRHALNAEKVKTSLAAFRTNLRKMLEDLDALDQEENDVLAEEGAAAAAAGGGTPTSSGVVNVASTTGPGTSTANVANFNGRVGIGLQTPERRKDHGP